MRRQLIRLAFIGALAVLVAGCDGAAHRSATRSTTEAAQVAHRVTRLRDDLPAGFDAPGRTLTPHGSAELAVAPAPADIAPSAFHTAARPTGRNLRRVVAAVINQPVPVRAGELWLSTLAPEPGHTVTVVATHLSSQANHDALFILSGPHGYRAERLVQVSNDIAAGIVTLPAHMARGTWYLLAQDLAEVTTDSSGHLGGTVLVDVGRLDIAQ